ncbi:MAG: helix-turn-helix transcriptional regulator [Holosporales bacterium]|jgi:transcriptional regulator with XRE-family HTH domain|nr:helix-turn-helix transcriptional regulator [Holosporales bacterium]
MDINKHIGNQLKLRRLFVGLSQEKLAERLGVTFQQVQKYEKGINKISAARLFAISKVLNTSISHFFEGIEPKCSVGPECSLLEDGSAYDEDILSKKETRDLLKAYYFIENSQTRKHVLDLIRAIPET